LQDEPVEFKVWDYDSLKSDDIIGIVRIDITNLALVNSRNEISGWFPIYDTLRGIRGRLKVQLTIAYFGNENQFQNSSAGVRFLSSLFQDSPPISLLEYSFNKTVDDPSPCFKIAQVLTFVEELIVEDDPEYSWADSFKSSRLSNEQRQILLYRLSGKLRRQIGMKVLELGGNTVLGYHQDFDLEKDL